MLPESFHWGWFLGALVLMAVPAGDLLHQRAHVHERKPALPDAFDRSRPCSHLKVASECLSLSTEKRLQFVDVTDLLTRCVRRWGIADGLVCVQSRHTTAAVVVNENEPLLLEDMRATLERVAPRDRQYAHDDLTLRADPAPDENRNGDAHCKALLLSPAVTLTVVHGKIELGPWQRVFLVELDGPRPRSLVVLAFGAAAGAGP